MRAKLSRIHGYTMRDDGKERKFHSVFEACVYFVLIQIVDDTCLDTFISRVYIPFSMLCLLYYNYLYLCCML